jgi:polyhydroxyalkanoate synthesis repressor PhaR
MTNERVIKKYANRRLYDSTASKHVTFDDIRKLILAGEQVKVVDDKSGEDLTRATLLQIIAEQEQFGTPVLSTDLLGTIIRFYGNPVQELLTRYLEQSFGSVLRQQKAMQAEMTKAFESPMGPFADLARQNMEMWSNMQASMLGVMGVKKGSKEAGTQAPAHSSDEAAEPQDGAAPKT